MRVCAHHSDFIGGPENKSCALPVRRRTGLQLVRVYRVDGPGGGGRSQTMGRDSRRCHLQGIAEAWPGSGEAVTSAPTSGRGSAASVVSVMNVGGLHEKKYATARRGRAK